MSGTLNKVMLIGHTGDEVKMHHFEGGGCVGRFPLATNETYKDKNSGEKITNTEWHNCVVRNKGAEICEKYLKKGDKVYVEGSIKTRKWQDNDGNERYSTEINVLNFTFLTPRDNSGQGGGSQSAVDQYEKNKKQSTQGDQYTEDEDDLPF